MALKGSSDEEDQGSAPRREERMSQTVLDITHEMGWDAWAARLLPSGKGTAIRGVLGPM